MQRPAGCDAATDCSATASASPMSPHQPPGHGVSLFWRAIQNALQCYRAVQPGCRDVSSLGDRLRWASSQWAPSKNHVGFRLGPSMASRHSALTVILSGWERAVCKRHAYRNASRMVAGPRRCRMCRWSASSFPAAIRNHPERLGGEESPSWYKHCNCNATADPNRLGRGTVFARHGSHLHGFRDAFLSDVMWPSTPAERRHLA